MPSFAVGAPCAPNNVVPIPGINPGCDPGCGAGGGGGGEVVTANTSTILLAGDGTSGNPLRAQIVPDPDDVYTRAEFIIYAAKATIVADTAAVAYIAPEETIFDANFGTSIGAVSNDVTAQIDVLRNGVDSGTISFANGVVTFTTPGFTLERGDVLTLVSPTTFSPDMIALTLVARVPVQYL